MAPTYKLYYFNIRGRAEPIRLLFTAAGVKYEDKRLSSEEWAKIKPDTPFGQMPFLEVDGVKIAQSKAILRLVAKRTGMAGGTDIEQAQVDMIGDCMEDALQKAVGAIYAPEAERAAKKKVFLEESMPQFLSNFEQFLANNKSGSGFFVGKKMTFADIMLVGMLDSFGRLGEVSIDKYPGLKSLVNKVNTQPKIAEWTRNRPKTDF